MDVHILFFVFGRVAWLHASREARLGRRVSDCVFASKFLGGWVDVKMLFLFLGSSRGCLRRGRLV